MKRYYKLLANHYSEVKYYMVDGKVKCVVYEVTQSFNMDYEQYLYTFDAMLKHLQDTRTNIRFVDNIYDTISDISSYYQHCLEISNNQFSCGLEIK